MMKTLVGIILFVVVAALYLYLAVKSKSGTLAFKHSLGVKSRLVESRPERWVAGHKAAWPLFLAGTLVTVFHGIGIAIAGFVMPQPDSSRFVDVLILSGLVVSVALYFVATAAAKEVAGHLEDQLPGQIPDQTPDQTGTSNG